MDTPKKIVGVNALAPRAVEKATQQSNVANQIQGPHQVKRRRARCAITAESVVIQKINAIANQKTKFPRQGGPSQQSY
jgi:hypothetical protein